jgi:hypothetical protein
MPMKRRVAIARHSSELLPIEMAFLRDEPQPCDGDQDLESDNHWWSMSGWAGGSAGPHEPRGYGDALRPSLEWIKESPGTRPSVWWTVESPEPRRRLGGTGQPGSRHMYHGVPASWSWPLPAEYVGKFIGGPPPCDPNDPPTFESQATYLRRHGLLFPGERDRLTAEDFEPEPIRPPRHVFRQ